MIKSKTIQQICSYKPVADELKEELENINKKGYKILNIFETRVPKTLKSSDQGFIIIYDDHKDNTPTIKPDECISNSPEQTRKPNFTSEPNSEQSEPIPRYDFDKIRHDIRVIFTHLDYKYRCTYPAEFIMGQILDLHQQESLLIHLINKLEYILNTINRSVELDQKSATKPRIYIMKESACKIIEDISVNYRDFIDLKKYELNENK